MVTSDVGAVAQPKYKAYYFFYNQSYTIKIVVLSIKKCWICFYFMGGGNGGFAGEN
jgi:hypothetical protein